jgi:putative oxidoreductase
MDRVLHFLRRISDHPSLALDLIRIYLGIALTVRGILFVTDSAMLEGFMSRPEHGWLFPMAVAHYVILAHVGGGILLTIGFLTRVAALIQVPVLCGAVFLVHLREGLLASGQSLELSMLVLFLLVVTAVFRPGRLSFDYYVSSGSPHDTWDEVPERKVLPFR